MKEQILEAIRGEVSTGAALYFSAACLVGKLPSERLGKEHLPTMAELLKNSISSRFNAELGAKVAQRILGLAA